jgi:hypothetical protein
MPTVLPPGGGTPPPNQPNQPSQKPTKSDPTKGGGGFDYSAVEKGIVATNIHDLADALSKKSIDPKTAIEKINQLEEGLDNILSPSAAKDAKAFLDEAKEALQNNEDPSAVSDSLGKAVKILGGSIQQK